MIQVQNEQSITVFSFNNVCMGFLRSADGGICLLNKGSAVKTLEALAKMFDSEYAEITQDRDAIRGIFDSLNNISKSLGVAPSLSSKAKVENALANADKAAREVYVAATEVRDLITLAKKHDKAQERIERLHPQASKVQAESKPSSFEDMSNYNSFGEFLASKLGLDVADIGGGVKGCGECDACKAEATEEVDPAFLKDLQSFEESLSSVLGKNVKVVTSPDVMADLKSGKIKFPGFPFNTH